MDDITRRDPVKITAEDINPRYNWGRHLPVLGTMGVDFEERVDYRRMHRYRLARAQAALEASDLGALLLFDDNNIRYVTSTKIGEWARDKLSRWALLVRGGDPILWDFGSAAVHHRLYSPWLKPENCKAGLVGLRGTVDPAFGLMKRHAEEMASILRDAGVAKMPIGVDIIEPPMMFELEKAGLKIKDGQQVMLSAREVKSADEIALLNRAAAMVDGAYDVVNQMLRPGIRENDIVAEVNKFLYTHGSDDVEAVNAISGERGSPHPHNFTDRMIRPGDQAFFDILQSFMGYRTCYYRTFNVGPRHAGAARCLQEGARMARQRHRPHQARRLDRAYLRSVPEGAGVRLPRRNDGVRPAIRPWPRTQSPRTADHLARGVDGSPDRDQGRHGVRDRNLLPGDRRLFGGAHRGRGRGHRQGLPADLAVPGGRTADLGEVLITYVPRTRCSAKRCTADPGSSQARRLVVRSPGRSRVCGAPLRFAPCCAAPGKRSRWL